MEERAGIDGRFPLSLPFGGGSNKGSSIGTSIVIGRDAILSLRSSIEVLAKGNDLVAFGCP